MALLGNTIPTGAILLVLITSLGGIAGAMPASLMFDLSPLQIAAPARTGVGQWTSEVVATVALKGAILGSLGFAPAAIPWLVDLTITAACWFTASTSFANAAVTMARMVSDSFAGIAPASALLLVPAQVVQAVLGLRRWDWLLEERSPRSR